MSDQPEKHVQDLISKAGKSEKASDAMQFSQAALNAAHAAHILANRNKTETN